MAIDKFHLYHGKSQDILGSFESNSIHSIVTSPPYWNLRDYHEEDQLGNEKTHEEFIENLCQVFDSCHRVLRDDGTAWVNLGDTIKDGNDLNIPFLFSEAMKKRGWYQRQWFPWLKRNAMPRGGDSRAHSNLEVIMMFSKRPKGYYYDQLSAKEQAGLTTRNFRNGDAILLDPEPDYWVFDVLTRKNWSEHFATFPPLLASIMVRASTSDHGVGVDDHSPANRIVKKKRYATRSGSKSKTDKSGKAFRDKGRHITEVTHIGWDIDKVEPAHVLDPFSGMATVGIVCLDHNRIYHGIELNEEYLEVSRQRLRDHKREGKVDVFDSV